ncbi:unnamed protein product, partial [Meganyctiphanes norvegica]
MAISGPKGQQKIVVLMIIRSWRDNIDVCIGPIPGVEGFHDIGNISNIVLKLTYIVPEYANYKIYKDNYVLSIPLFVEMAKKGHTNVGYGEALESMRLCY